LPTGVDEQLRYRNVTADAEPGFESNCRFLEERQHSLFTSLATNKNARRRLKCKVIHPQPGEFGYAQSRGDGEVQQGTIANAASSGRVRCIEDGPRLFAVEKGNQLGVGFLEGNGQDLADGL
jgi:hypothetical protein